MGIPGLSKLLSEHVKRVNISKHAHKRWAVDAPQLGYVALHSERYSRYPNGYVLNYAKNLEAMLKQGIKPVFVFDGPRPAPQKGHVIQQRKDQRQKSFDKSAELKIEVRKIGAKISTLQEEKYEVVKLVSNLRDSGDVQKYLQAQQQQELLEMRELMLKREHLDTVKRSGRLERYSKAFKKTQMDELGTILKYIGVPAIRMSGEAENVCSMLARKSIVDVVYTQDSDSLVCGSPVVLKNWSEHSEFADELELSSILHSLKIDQTQFVDFCILLGCDYLKQKITWPKGVTPLQFVKEHKTTEAIINHIMDNKDQFVVEDTWDTQFREARDIYTLYQDSNLFKIPDIDWNMPSHPSSLRDFLTDQAQLPGNVVDHELRDLFQMLKSAPKRTSLSLETEDLREFFASDMTRTM